MAAVPPVPTPELILRFATIAQLIVIGSVAIRDLRPGWTGYLAALFCFGVSSYLICPLIGERADLGLIEVVFFFGCFGNPVFFWLLSRAIFEDQFRWHPMHLALLAVVEATGFWHRVEHGLGTSTVWGLDLVEVSRVAYQFPALAIIVWALVRAYQGRAVDLVGPRRRFRDVFVAVCGAYMILVVVTEILLRGEAAVPEVELLNLAAIFVLTTAIAITMFKPAPGAFAVARGQPRQPGDRSPADQRLLDALTRFTDQGGYRQEGLTIGKLAGELGAAEHALRRLINRDQGFRNFNEFLNSHRIREARARLVAPESARIPVLTIAMDLGYRSLGPFNRAFKEETGMTPTEYRAAHLSHGPDEG